MLKRINRLTKTKEIQKLLKNGRSFYCPYFMFKILPNEKALLRLGVIVSNKVSKKATQRNLIKRRLREIIRLSLKELKPGYDLIILASPRIIDPVTKKVLSYEQIKSQLLNLLYKGGIL